MFVLIEGWHGTYEKKRIGVLKTYRIAGRTLCLVDTQDTNKDRKYAIMDYEIARALAYSPNKKLPQNKIQELEDKLLKVSHDNYEILYQKYPVVNGPQFQLGYDRARELLSSLPPAALFGFKEAVKEFSTNSDLPE